MHWFILYLEAAPLISHRIIHISLCLVLGASHQICVTSGIALEAFEIVGNGYTW